MRSGGDNRGSRGSVSRFGDLRINARLPASRSLSQAAASFVASRCQDIRRTPLRAWPQLPAATVPTPPGEGGAAPGRPADAPRHTLAGRGDGDRRFPARPIVLRQSDTRARTSYRRARRRKRCSIYSQTGGRARRKDVREQALTRCQLRGGGDHPLMRGRAAAGPHARRAPTPSAQLLRVATDAARAGSLTLNLIIHLSKSCTGSACYRLA